jgi:hypothetical protein
MTVALVLAAAADSGQLTTLCGQLTALGVQRVDAAEPNGSGSGLLTIAAAARAAGEQVLVCSGDLFLSSDDLARLLGASGTAALTGALLVDKSDLAELAEAAESLARTNGSGDRVGALLGELARRRVAIQVLDVRTDTQGAVAECLADPVARDIARWATDRRLSQAALYGISLGLGLLSAVWFTEPSLGAKAVGVLALLAAFVISRAAGLAGGSGAVRPVIDWLSAAGWTLTEFAVYAGLAASTGTGLGAAAESSGNAGVWRLAVAAMLVLGVRQMADLCYSAGKTRGRARVPRSPLFRRAEQVIALPAGERVALIAVTALGFAPKVTFISLLCLSALAAGYVLSRQVFGERPPDPDRGYGGQIAAYRDDGPLSLLLGRLVEGRLPALAPAIVGVYVTCLLTFLGLANIGVLVLTPVMAMLLAGLGSANPHRGRLDWLIPPLLQTGEYVYLTALAFASQVPVPAVFALVSAVVMRHLDIAYRARHSIAQWPGRASPDKVGLGWEGRMLVAGFAAVFGITTFANIVGSGYLWWLFGWDFLTGWLSFKDHSFSLREVDSQ